MRQESCEVLVVGGGSAGVAAAVAAARAGAETVLVERADRLGGMGSLALVHTICGLYLLQEQPEPVFANPGFAEEFATRLQRSGGAGEAVRMGRVDVLPHVPKAFAALARQITQETSKLRLWTNTELVAAFSESTELNAPLFEVEVKGLEGKQLVRAAAFVDTTGDATLTALAGGAFAMTEPSRLQRPAYIFQLADVPREALTSEARLTLAGRLVQAVREGRLPRACLGAGFRAGVMPGSCFVTLDLAGDDGDGSAWDPFSPEALHVVEAQGETCARLLWGFLRENVNEFKDAKLAAWPTRPGVRESRRAQGRYELTGDDIRHGTQFEDGVALATWPMEFRERPTGARLVYPEGPPAQIPLRALQHRDVPNLFMAGRCLSATHEAQASIRVMGTCFATGEAAGRAAAALAQSPPC